MKDNFERQISVIIPVYNCKKYLEVAVQSVLEQPYKKIEIILVDDGSTDGSSELCDRIEKENKFVQVIHKKNEGVSSARNTGIEYIIQKGCDEDYIAFLDGDDAWSGNSVTEDMKRLLNFRYDLIGFQSCKCNQDMTYRNQPAPQSREGEFSGGKNAVWSHSSHFGAMFYKVNFLKKYNIKFNPIKYSEDKIFLMECLFLANKVYLENRLFYIYRTNESSAMHRREKGIVYYLPIVDSYLQLDCDMEVWADDVRGELREGRLLARLYLMDMIEEHYQYGGKRRDMMEFLKEHSDYIRLLNDNKIGSRELSERWEYIKSHSKIIQIKNILWGIIYRSRKMILKLPMLNKLYEKRKYPIKILSISES